MFLGEFKGPCLASGRALEINTGAQREGARGANCQLARTGVAAHRGQIILMAHVGNACTQRDQTALHLDRWQGLRLQRLREAKGDRRETGNCYIFCSGSRKNCGGWRLFWLQKMGRDRHGEALAQSGCWLASPRGFGWLLKNLRRSCAVRTRWFVRCFPSARSHGF